MAEHLSAGLGTSWLPVSITYPTAALFSTKIADDWANRPKKTEGSGKKHVFWASQVANRRTDIIFVT